MKFYIAFIVIYCSLIVIGKKINNKSKLYNQEITRVIFDSIVIDNNQLEESTNNYAIEGVLFDKSQKINDDKGFLISFKYPPQDFVASLLSHVNQFQYQILYNDIQGKIELSINKKTNHYQISFKAYDYITFKFKIPYTIYNREELKEELISLLRNIILIRKTIDNSSSISSLSYMTDAIIVNHTEFNKQKTPIISLVAINEPLKKDSNNLWIYNISLISINILYYFTTIGLLIGLFIAVKYSGEQCTKFFILHNYIKNKKNYSPFVYTTIICFCISIQISLLCYFDFLLGLVFSINSLLISNGIFFVDLTGAIYGASGFGIFSLYISICLIPIQSFITKAFLSIAITGLFTWVGFIIGKYHLFTLEKPQHKAGNRKPVLLLTE